MTRWQHRVFMVWIVTMAFFLTLAFISIIPAINSSFDQARFEPVKPNAKLQALAGKNANLPGKPAYCPQLCAHDDRQSQITEVQ